MDLGVISVRYARALLKSATDLKQEDAVYSEMQTLAKSYLQVPQLRFTIDNPMLAKDKKLALLQTACGNELTKLTTMFLQLVLKENREHSSIHGKLVYHALPSGEEDNPWNTDHRHRRLSPNRGEDEENG